MRFRTTVVAVAIVCAAGLSACSDDEPEQQGSTQSSEAPSPSDGTAYTDEQLVEALPSEDEPDTRHGLAVFEECTDFEQPGDCLEQEEGTALVNLTDGMNQGILVTVVRDHSDEAFDQRAETCPEGTIDEPSRKLETGVEIPGRKGSGERTDWSHEGWTGWVCEAEYTQVDSDGTTEDEYEMRLLLATNGEHLLSVRTATDVDVELWAREYVDRLSAS